MYEYVIVCTSSGVTSKFRLGRNDFHVLDDDVRLHVMIVLLATFYVFYGQGFNF